MTTPFPAIPRPANFGVKNPPDWADPADEEPGVWVDGYRVLHVDISQITPGHKYGVISNGQPNWVLFTSDGKHRKLQYLARIEKLPGEPVPRSPVVKS